MTKQEIEEKIAVKKLEQPQHQPIDKVETIKLESLAFKIGEQIKGLQRQYNEVYKDLVRREQEKSQQVTTDGIKTN